MEFQNLRIFIPDEEVWIKAQIKAFELGYVYPSRNIEIRKLKHNYLHLFKAGNMAYGNHRAMLKLKDISYQDFLNLNPELPKNFKIDIRELNNYYPKIEKLLNELPINEDRRLQLLYHSKHKDPFKINYLYIYENGECYKGSIEDFFINKDLPEVKLESFIKLKIKTRIKMNSYFECTTTPKKVLYIHLGGTYEGILLNKEETQVDILEEAEFLLVDANDAGNQARYNIDLFSMKEKAVDNLEALCKTIEFNEHRNTISILGDYAIFNIENFKIQSLDGSCGARFLHRINSAVSIIKKNLEELMSLNKIKLSNEELITLTQEIFKFGLLSLMDIRRESLFVLYTNNRYGDIIWPVLDELSVTDPERNRAVNPKENSNTAMWVINKELLDFNNEHSN